MSEYTPHDEPLPAVPADQPEKAFEGSLTIIWDHEKAELHRKLDQLELKCCDLKLDLAEIQPRLTDSHADLNIKLHDLNLRLMAFTERLEALEANVGFINHSLQISSATLFPDPNNPGAFSGQIILPDSPSPGGPN